MPLILGTTRSGVQGAIETPIGVVVPGCASVGSSAGAEAFAARILTRHAVDCACLVPIDCTLLARPQPEVTNVFEMLATLTVRPDFVVRLAPEMRRRMEMPPMRAVDRLPMNAAPRRSTSAAMVRALFERMFARERRIETEHGTVAARRVAPPGAAGSGARPAGRLAVARSPIAEMVLRRTNPASQPSGRTPRPDVMPHAPSAGRLVDTRLPVDVSRSQAAVPLSPGELGRVTDEVVRAIDRRIIAERERRGAR